MSYYQNKRQYWKTCVGRPTLGGGATRRFYRSQKQRRSFVPRTMGPFAVSESKYYDTELVAQVIDSVGTSWAGSELDPTTINTLCAPPEGSDINERIGRKISVYKLSLRGVLYGTAQTDQGDVLISPLVRLILYQDKQTNGTQAQGEELMASTTGSASIFSHQNLANLGRFRVLRDVTYKIGLVETATDGTATASENVASHPFKMVVRFKKPVVVKFNGTSTPSVGDIVDNSFHLIGQDYGQIPMNITYTCRAYYKDA